MQQLKSGHIMKLYLDLCKTHKPEDVLEMPVYIGDDDELNGIHCAWFCEKVSKDDEDVVEMINERAGNYKFKGNAILIG